MYCEKCGRELESGAVRCPSCDAAYPGNFVKADMPDFAALYASPDVMSGTVFDEDDYASRILIGPPPIDSHPTSYTTLDERMQSAAEEIARVRRSVGLLRNDSARVDLFSRESREVIVSAIEDCGRDLSRCEVLLRGIAEMARTARVEQGQQHSVSGEKALGIGDVVGGRFGVGKLLRQSSLGGVYEVSDMQDDGALCIAKVPGPGPASWLIREEARILAKLDHPRIPRLIASSAEGNHPWLVEQYFDGFPLEGETVLSGFGSEISLCRHAIDVCDALSYLHRQDPPILHHDIKPTNIFVTREGEVCLIDFGIAMECRPEGESDAVICGTPGFAAPETLREPHRSDPRSDIYSAGATMWHMMAESSLQERFSELPLPDVRVGKEDGPWKPITDEFAEVIMKCVRMNPDDRYQTADELATALKSVIAGHERGEPERACRDQVLGAAALPEAF